MGRHYIYDSVIAGTVGPLHYIRTEKETGRKSVVERVYALAVMFPEAQSFDPGTIVAVGWHGGRRP